MERIIFKNANNYSVEVPTPSGAGRLVHAGGFVEGDYFTPLWREHKILERVPDPSKVDPKLIVCVAYKKAITEQMIDNIKMESAYTSEVPTNLKGTEHLVEATAPVMVAPPPVAASASVPVAMDAKGSLEASLETAIKEANLATPTIAEVEKMSMQQLRAVGDKLGIAPIGNRNSYLKFIKSKLQQMNA